MRIPYRIKSYKDAKRPTLKYVVNFKEGGRRARRFFQTKKEAETLIDQMSVALLNQGREGLEFPTQLRVLAQQADEILKPFGKTVLEAAEFFAKHLRAVSVSKRVADVVTEFLATRKADGASDDYRADLRIKYAAFCRTFGDAMIAEIPAKAVSDWLRQLGVSAVSRNTTRSRLMTLFTYARQQGYTPKNPLADVAPAKERSGEVGILSVEETAKLIAQASPETLPYWAIGAFAGLRSAEIERLDFKEIHFDSGLIEVKASKSKTASRRLVVMHPNLRQWLAPYAKQQGSVCPGGLRKRLEADRDRAGLRDQWPQNALRHSFGSYHLAQFNDMAALALQMGNSPKIIFQHYRELVKPQDAARYWNLVPLSAGKIVEIGEAA